MYFYNIPSLGIGLPYEIELHRGATEVSATDLLGHAILGNSDLSQEDNTTRNVTIAAIAKTPDDEDPYHSLSISFGFPDNSPIRWLILSEVQICTQQGTYIVHL